ncbi:DUF397 domain-containing protein [Saccharopolyspora gloriosae]|uniref:DUF397 domain-containing protein n=1 Tax=Saccharopolyspora gloriosae TaxID=455344 RepID=UPI001FB7DE2F|nr:DUF397 domain-containing protein [Saccharopolyspora gloriosae]
MDTGWFKSGKSSGGSDNCVEVRITTDEVGVRDSKERSGPAFAFPLASWSAFLADAKAGRFNR